MPDDSSSTRPRSTTQPEQPGVVELDVHRPRPSWPDGWRDTWNGLHNWQTKLFLVERIIYNDPPADPKDQNWLWGVAGRILDELGTQNETDCRRWLDQHSVALRAACDMPDRTERELAAKRALEKANEIEAARQAIKNSGHKDSGQNSSP